MARTVPNHDPFSRKFQGKRRNQQEIHIMLSSMKVYSYSVVVVNTLTTERLSDLTQICILKGEEKSAMDKATRKELDSNTE